MIPNQILNSCPITLFCSVVLYINTRAKNKDEQAEAMVDGNRIVKINSGESHNIQSLLSSADRDFLVRNNGDQVKVDSLKGKKIGLYFSASWCGPCRNFTPVLIDVYNEISSNGDFEVIYVSRDMDEDSYNEYFSKMSWLAVPFSDSGARVSLLKLFKVKGIPNLVLMDDNGMVLTHDGVDFIKDYGTEAYPFTAEKINDLKEQEARAKREQSLKSLLVTDSRDFVISSNGEKIPVSALEGKTVGLYFWSYEYKPLADYTSKIVEVYKELKQKGERFEIVWVSYDDKEESFMKGLESMPWLALPFNSKSSEKLARYFELSKYSTLVIIGPDGKTLKFDAEEDIQDFGSMAFPFTPEKFVELVAVRKAQEEAQTLESFLVSGDLDYVIGKDGVKVPLSDLVGKNILLDFSAHWCSPCRALLPKLVEAYHKIKEKDQAFEVVFISLDSDKSEYEKMLAEMPWLALPFGDARQTSLNCKFKVEGIPKLVAIGPTGRTVTTDAHNMIATHGADAYPFTEEKLKEVEMIFDEKAKGWPEKIKHELHEHELLRSRYGGYDCDGCNAEGNLWTFYCADCDFHLHPKCSLKEENDVKEESSSMDGWICDGNVCKRA